MTNTQEHLTMANASLTGAMNFQAKLMKGIGIALMVLGGLLCLTVIGALMGIPLIIIGLVVYFVMPKIFSGMHKAMMPPGMAAPKQPPAQPPAP